MGENNALERLAELEEESEQLLDDVQTFSDAINDFQEILDDSPNNYVNQKKSIVTTMSNRQPNFIGKYAGMTNADFAAGSICYVVSN